MVLKYSKEQYQIWREKIREFSDGSYASDVAEKAGCHAGYVRKVWSQERHLSRQKSCSPRGPKNSAWTGGRILQRCGRVLVPAPVGHPLARVYGNKKIGRIFEHRLAMEKHLGRYLTKKEVVDHIDECVLHNDIKNLRLFATNAEHLRETISGRAKDISALGRISVQATHDERKYLPRYNKHKKMWQSGDVRLLQILHAWLLLDKESPYLLGTHRYLLQNKIDPENDREIKENVILLCRKWELPHKLSRLEHLL